MLRTERKFEPHRVQEEIDIYNELLPVAGELPATMFIEIANLDELRRRLPELVGIEFAIWLDVELHQVHARGEEGRSTEAKTSTVRYLRCPAARCGAGARGSSAARPHPH